MSSNAKLKEKCDAKNRSSSGTKLDKTAIKEIKSVIPKKRQELLKWDGWGYKDSYFTYENGQMVFKGDRYPIGGGVTLPAFKKYCQERLNIDLSRPPNRAKMPTKFPEPNLSSEFLAVLKKLNFDYSLDGQDRLVRSHGQTLHDIAAVRQGGFKRIPDIVVWPKSHQDVEDLVALGSKLNVAIIPFGGGTSVSGAATCPQDEQRCMVALDTSQMNRILWLNKASLTACFESGIIGQDLERELNIVGLTLGHEPDSYEFSSLGGWVATRASGMKKNVYGNIEDLVVSVKMVTCKGTLERKVSAPRISSGPDFNHVILGSEGTLGVITEVQLKVRPLPQVRRYGSLVFANFSHGVKFMREVAKQRCQPASIRLVDNEQFKVAQAMRPGDSITQKLTDYLKKLFLQRMIGFDVDELVAVTLLFEGDKKAVTRQQQQIEQIAEMFGGVPTGSKNGKKGYLLTFVIAYVRDIALDYSVVAESFETSTSWDRCETLCRNVKFCIEKVSDFSLESS